MPSLPPYAPRGLVAERLPLVFPEGTPNRTYRVRELAASTIFTALYIGAVEGADRHLGPAHVHRVTAEQATKADADDREAYGRAVRNKARVPGVRWYTDNTREPIRDGTLRDGLVAIGAVTRREDLPTTFGAARYALSRPSRRCSIRPCRTLSLSGRSPRSRPSIRARAPSPACPSCSPAPRAARPASW